MTSAWCLPLSTFLVLFAAVPAPALLPPFGSTALVSSPDDVFAADRSAGAADISGDGRVVVFSAGDSAMIGAEVLYPPGGRAQIYARDLVTGQTELLSKALHGGPADGDSFYPTVSGDGRHVAFLSRATDLVGTPRHPSFAGFGAYIHDRSTGETKVVAVDAGGFVVPVLFEWPRMSADGRYVVVIVAGHALDPEHPAVEESRLFVVDLATQRGRLASIDPGGAHVRADRPDISADGRTVVFWVRGGETWRVYLHDLTSGTTIAVSQDDEDGFQPALSGDGSVVAYMSYDPEDTGSIHSADLVAWDRLSGDRRSLPASVEPYDAIAVSHDGRYVVADAGGVFASEFPLGPLPAALHSGAYRWDRLSGGIEYVSVADDGQVPWQASMPQVSDDGQRIVFDTIHSLAAGDRPYLHDVYLREVAAAPPLVG